MPNRSPSVPRLAAAVLVAAALLAACAKSPPAQPGAEVPAQAVRALADRLRANDPAGFATVAVPPALHARLETAWRTGRSRWPLDELPLDDRLPAMLAALAEPNARTDLQRTFDAQFANSADELRSTATSLGDFGVQYIRNEGDYSAAERDHYTQTVAVLSRWAANAPLSDGKRARRAIALLSTAAAEAGITAPEDFANHGMDESLERLGPFLAATKQVFGSYGLNLDASFDGLDATLVQQTGDTARVRVRYPLAGEEIDTILDVTRIGGRWYLADYLRNAEASLDGPAVRATTPPAPASTRSTAPSP
ncbi:hypothetical protein AB4059_07890 [Lysobacter sp. 2RAF19]